MFLHCFLGHTWLFYRASLDLVFKTFQVCRNLLIILAMFAFIACVFFGALLFIIEQGTFTANATFPNGFYETQAINQVTTQESLFANCGMLIIIMLF